MRRFLSTLVTLLWGLWFGGLVTLFIAVMAIFGTLQGHDLAGEVAARLFETFNAYQLILAAAALLGTFIWYVAGAPRGKMTLFSLLAIATFAAGVGTFYIAPRIVLLHDKGLVHTPQFNRLHGASMIVYLVETLALLIAGAVLARIRQ